MRKYKLLNEISRGRFSSVQKSQRQDDQRIFACKIIDNEEKSLSREFEVYKSLRNDRVVSLYEAFSLPKATTFIMEYIGGPNVLDFFTSRISYTEEDVANGIIQVIFSG